jgi:hypothetical protein
MGPDLCPMRVRVSAPFTEAIGNRAERNPKGRANSRWETAISVFRATKRVGRNQATASDKCPRAAGALLPRF